MLSYLSVCSGIEAASVAYGPLGWKSAAFAEVEKFACALLAKRYPDVPNLGDIRGIDGRNFRGQADLLVGGSPCQAFSVAGRRKGMDDERGNLTLEFLRVARELRSEFVKWENVPGVLSIEKGAVFAHILDSFLRMGYIVNCDILDAQFFGLAQRRRRVFLVCQRADSLMQKTTPTSLATLANLLAEVSRDLLSAAPSTASPRGKKKKRSKSKEGAALHQRLTRKMMPFKYYGDILFQQWLNNLDAAYVLNRAGEGLEAADGDFTSQPERGAAPLMLPGLRDFFAEKAGESPQCPDRSLKNCWGKVFALAENRMQEASPVPLSEHDLYLIFKTLVHTGRLLLPLKASCTVYDYAALSVSTAIQDYMRYARQSDEGLLGQARFHVVWADLVREAERLCHAFKHSGEGADPTKILSEFGSVQGDTAPGRSTQADVAGTFKACAGSGGWSNSAEHAAAGYMQPVAPGCADIAGTFTRNAYSGGAGGRPEGAAEHLFVCQPLPDEHGCADIAGTLASRYARNGGAANGDITGGRLITQSLTGRLDGGGPDDNKAQGGFYVVCESGTDAWTEDVALPLCAEGHDASEDGTGRQNLVISARESGPGFWTEDDIAGPLRAEGTRPGRTSQIIVAPPLTAKAPYDDSESRQDLLVPCADSVTAQAGHTHTVLAFHGSQDPDVSGGVTHPLGRNQGLEACICAPGTDTAGSVEYEPLAFTQNQEGEVLTGNIAGAMGTNSNASGRNTPKVLYSGVRRLMVSECELLMGFPVNYTNIPYKHPYDKLPLKIVLRSYNRYLARMQRQMRAPLSLADLIRCADGPRYKALGNSMAVTVMRWIAERMEKYLAEEDVDIFEFAMTDIAYSPHDAATDGVTEHFAAQ